MNAEEKKYCIIFGGAFDPPHLGHANCILAALNSSHCAELILVPSADQRYDRKPFVSGVNRLEMLKLLIAENFNEAQQKKISISAAQIDGSLSAKSLAIDLVNYFKLQKPQQNIGFLIGQDNLAGLEKWQDFENLRNNCTFFVVSRDGENNVIANKNGQNIKFVKLESVPVKISSSEIRELVRQKKYSALEGLLGRQVSAYIAEKLLYLA